MIEKINIHKVASYENLVQIIPKKINFIYGSNGSGKTTLSKLIGNHIISDDCQIERNHTDDVKTLVYNNDFVKTNFQQSKFLSGIFTLGEDSIDAQTKLEELQEMNKKDSESITTKYCTIEGFDREVTIKKEVLQNKCWKVKGLIEEQFRHALVGYMNSKSKFMEKCFSTYETLDKTRELNLQELKKRYNIAFSENSKSYTTFSLINISDVLNHELSDLLEKVITGSADSPIGELINKIKNSDWVKQGLSYMNDEQDKCPFCQQFVSGDLKKEIEEYFDETYEVDCRLLRQFIDEYKNFFICVLLQIKEIVESDIPFVDVKQLEVKYQLLESLFKLNIEELEKKLKSPSNKITIVTTQDLVKEINMIIKEFNESIESNNRIVNNQKQEREESISEVWVYIVSKLQSDIEEYLKFAKGKTIARESISQQIGKLELKISNNNTAIEQIENSLTSVAPTVKEINEILAKFDFHGFSLKENIEKKGTYIILREDGTDATDTLSEGEYNFITFLYFYHLVYGSQEKTGITSSKIVVIDDPISSLDSNVLFIVSTLVKNILKDCREDKNGVLQTFILTHNVYFHKEVTFLGSRESYSPKAVLFGVLRKKDNVTYFKEYENNPIESSYQLLWRELTDDKLSTVTAFNTMRRILEYYFKIIGDIDYEKCIDEFDGNDKVVSKSLVSCINDGSHFISDDFVITFDEDNISNYKRIFELIFEKLGHKQHYNMMMKLRDKN